LTPDLSPLENAQRYFDRYNRAKRAQAGVPELIENTQRELAFLEQLTLDLEQASSYPEIDDVVAALMERGLWQGAPPRAARRRAHWPDALNQGWLRGLDRT
jgi:predicted ribosome quality control (RQC) complex YloA/Tae2 family protein